MQNDFYEHFGANVKIRISETAGHLVESEYETPEVMFQYVLENVEGSGVTAQSPLNPPATDEEFKNNGVLKKFD